MSQGEYYGRKNEQHNNQAPQSRTPKNEPHNQGPPSQTCISHVSSVIDSSFSHRYLHPPLFHNQVKGSTLKDPFPHKSCPLIGPTEKMRDSHWLRIILPAVGVPAACYRLEKGSRENGPTETKRPRACVRGAGANQIIMINR